MDLTELDASALVARMQKGDVTAEDAMRACLARIDTVNPRVNAVVALRDPDGLIAEARAADNARANGEAVGWLHGIPIAVKDLANVAGLPTSKGSPILAGTIARSDDLFVSRMRAAGAIFIGKTNAPEFGLGSHTTNPVYGATLNPYALDGAGDRSAGGSSGGAAVALATGMQWVCDGSDMMGSLRNPAGWNNVYGFRPSFGRIPGEPEGDIYMHPLSTMGPMARSPQDMAALLDVMSGPDPRQPVWLKPESYSGRLECTLKDRRIGWIGDWGGAWPMEPGVMEHCQNALVRFQDLGVEIVEIAPPMPAHELWHAWATLRSYSVAARVGPLYDQPDKRALLRRDAIWEVERGRAFTGQEIQAASFLRSKWSLLAAELFAGPNAVDALAMPTAQCWPFPVDWDHPKSIAGQQMDTYHRWMECVIPASLIGLPAAGIPAGLGQNGLPMGLQILGPQRGDLGVLQFCQGWHEMTDWPAQLPALRKRRE